MEEKRQLDEQLRAVMDKYKYKRRQIRELQEDLQTMGHTLDNLTRDEEAWVLHAFLFELKPGFDRSSCSQLHWDDWREATEGVAADEGVGWPGCETRARSEAELEIRARHPQKQQGGVTRGGRSFSKTYLYASCSCHLYMRCFCSATWTCVNCASWTEMLCACSVTSFINIRTYRKPWLSTSTKLVFRHLQVLEVTPVRAWRHEQAVLAAVSPVLVRLQQVAQESNPNQLQSVCRLSQFW